MGKKQYKKKNKNTQTQESKKQKDNPFLKKDKDVIAKTSWS